MSKKTEFFEKTLSIKTEPELRHVLAHIYYSIECLCEEPPCVFGALDNLKSIEGLIMFDGDGARDWESYYEEMARRGRLGKALKMKMKKKKDKKKKKKKGKCKGK